MSLLLTLALTLCFVPSFVAATGSIQPFHDGYCMSPQANATLIPYTPDTATCQHDKDRAGIPIAFIYTCNHTDFQLTQWYNATQCDNTVLPTLNIVASPVWACAVADYTSPSESYLFYARVDCSASQLAPEAEKAVEQSKVRVRKTLTGSRMQRRHAKRSD